MEEGPTFRVALIGGGIVAQRYVQAIRGTASATLVGVAEIDAQRRGQIAMQAGVNAYADYRDMLRRTRPDVAIVALPHYLHLDAAEAALSAGAHVLIEKPLEISLDRCDRIAEAAHRHQRQVFVGHTQRYYAHIAETRRLLETGAIGAPMLITELFHQRYFTRGRPRWYLDPGKAGGGILMNQGIHLVDRASWLLDSRVEAVHASLAFHPEHRGVEALAIVDLWFDNGARAGLNVSGFGGETFLTFIAGTEGSLQITGEKTILVKRPKSDEGLYAEHTVQKIAPESPLPALQAELQSFLDALASGAPPEIDLQWGRYVVAVVQAAYLSARRGERVRVVA